MFKRNPNISHESMEKFMQAHGQFAKQISDWLFARAAEKNFSAIEHYMEACSVFMLEAASRIKLNSENIAETQFWN